MGVGARMLRRAPAFTGLTVLVLALCLGANLTIFAIIDAILLQPLPFPEPDRLVAMHNEYPKADLGRSHSSIPNLYGRQSGIPALASVGGYAEDAVILGDASSAQKIPILRVSAGFLATLGVMPAAGRAFTEEDMTFKTHHVVILGHAYWLEHFAGRRDVLGRTIRINGFDKVVVGVLPAGFQFLSSRPVVLLPLSSSNAQRAIGSLHNSADCDLIARLAPGATLADAQAQVDAHNAAVGRDFPYAKQVEATGFRTVVSGLHASHVASVRPTLVLIQAAGGVLLAIWAANFINLLLFRSVARSGELAVRQSLGATRSRVVRQIVTETVLLTLIGGACGLACGYLGIRALAIFGVDQLPLGLGVTLTARTAIAAVSVSIAVGVITGLPVAWMIVRSVGAGSLHAGARGTVGLHAGTRLRDGFVVAQVALAFVLLSTVGLLAVNLRRVMQISPGFDTDSVLVGDVSMKHAAYFAREARVKFSDRAVSALAVLPGVQAVGVASNIPVGGSTSGNFRRVMSPEGRVDGAAEALPLVPHVYGVAGGYFHALGIPLRSGSLWQDTGLRGDIRVCVVDEVLARRSWGDADPVGRWICDGPDVVRDGVRFQVIGVVGAVKQTELTEASSDGTMYVPLRDNVASDDTLHVVVRTSLAPEALASSVRGVLHEVEPELPVNDLRSMDLQIADSLRMRRSPVLLAGCFAAVALLMAMIGTYAVLSFAVTCHRREIGVRLALGARPGQIRRQYLAMGARLFSVALVLGVIGAVLAGQAVRGLLYDMVPVQPGLMFAAGALLGVMTLLACVLPASRAARVDPMVTLRCE